MDDGKPVCENCEGFTSRTCPRCGQRICRRCARDHHKRSYGDPAELWKKCEKQHQPQSAPDNGGEERNE